MATRSARENRFLAALTVAERLRLDPHLQFVELAAGTTLYEPGDPIDTLYFLHTGQVSLLCVAEDGEETESAAIGCEGVVGLGGLISGNTSFTRQRMLLAGVASSIPRAPFLDALDNSPRLRRIVAAHQDAFCAQLLQSVYCQGMHHAGQRIARWLLVAFDAVPDGRLLLTQEALARALGLRRATVTLVLNQAGTAGLLRIERGRIDLVDRAGLEALACRCYAIIREAFDRVPEKR